MLRDKKTERLIVQFTHDRSNKTEPKRQLL